jgi:SAM-dependent methyltransferase
MYKRMKQIFEKPPLYMKSKAAFWNEEHISQQMLNAHLDPNFEGASRKADFIEKSAQWIGELLPPNKYHKLLDLGCGPGLYTERFAKMGYEVTGIDFSERSIDYAKKMAKQQKLDISYHCQDYLNMDLDTTFDVSTMIYCDYGALSIEDRKKLRNYVYDHLNSGGRFLFDVFSMKFYNQFKENKSWEIRPEGGFWSGEEYMLFQGNYKYEEYVTLEQMILMTDDKITPYYLWNTCFTKESLIGEVEETGFKVIEAFGDVAGDVYHKDKTTMAILLEK